MSYTLDHAYDLLASAHQRGRLAHAFLISGPQGCGKERLAARIMSLVNASGSFSFAEESLDELEGEALRLIRPESKSRKITVDQMRALEDFFHLTTRQPGQWRVAVIVDADRLSDSAQNAFLKTLEEPPNRSLLLLLTEAPERLLPTTLSRTVFLPLRDRGNAFLLTEEAQSLLKDLSSHFQNQALGSVGRAFGFGQKFAQRLKSRREAIAKRLEKEMRAEMAEIRDRVDDTQQKSKEKEAEAAAEAQYLAERMRHIGVLTSWFGDALRQQRGYERLELGEFADVTKEMAKRIEPTDLLHRLQAIEAMQESLMRTNVRENIAFDVAFLRAMA